MELKEVLLKRRSVRKFTEEPVEKVKKMLGLGSKLIPLNIIFVGHPAEEPAARDQYEEKCVHYIE